MSIMSHSVHNNLYQSLVLVEARYWYPWAVVNQSLWASIGPNAAVRSVRQHYEGQLRRVSCAYKNMTNGTGDCYTR